LTIDGFLGNLSKEIDYKFGSAWRYSDKSLGVMVPILKIGQEKGFEERDYITIEEAKDDGISFKDTGRIDRVIVESSLGKIIFIRSGTALKSTGTQPRAVETSIAIVPETGKKGVEIPVRCIYSSKPISGGTKFTYAGNVPTEVRSALLSKSGQIETWSAVGHATHRLMSTRLGSTTLGSHNYAINNTSNSNRSNRSTTDNLVGVMEEVDKFTGNIDEILAKVPLFEDQVGAVFLDMKDVVGMEMFDHPKSWEAIHKEVEKRLGESGTKEEDKSFFKPDYETVKPLTFGFLKRLLESKKEETSHGIVSTISLKGDGVVGEATTINGKVIHLVGIKVENKVKSPSTNTVVHDNRDILRNIGVQFAGNTRSSRIY
jgi:hypothetical protein